MDKVRQYFSVRRVDISFVVEKTTAIWDVSRIVSKRGEFDRRFNEEEEAAKAKKQEKDSLLKKETNNRLLFFLTPPEGYLKEAVNVFMLDAMSAGLASAVNYGSAAASVGANSCYIANVNAVIVAHEIGHCLALFHTHHGYNDKDRE